MDRLRADGDARLARLGIPRVPVPDRPAAVVALRGCDMWERVCSLNELIRLIFMEFRQKLSDQHNDCLDRVQAVETY